MLTWFLFPAQSSITEQVLMGYIFFLKAHCLLWKLQSVFLGCWGSGSTGPCLIGCERVCTVLGTSIVLRHRGCHCTGKEWKGVLSGHCPEAPLWPGTWNYYSSIPVYIKLFNKWNKRRAGKKGGRCGLCVVVTQFLRASFFNLLTWDVKEDDFRDPFGSHVR